MNDRMSSKVPPFRARPKPGAPPFPDFSKLTNEQIEREIAELPVKITELPKSLLLKAKLEAKQFLLTAELKSRRESGSWPTIEEIERELAQGKDKLDEANDNEWSKAPYARKWSKVGELESKMWRLEFVWRYMNSLGEG
jgi:hypothetical protein